MKKAPMINDDRTTREQAWEEGYKEAIKDVEDLISSCYVHEDRLHIKWSSFKGELEELIKD